MTKTMELEEVDAVSTHTRIDWDSPAENPNVQKGNPVVVVRTAAGKWLAVAGAHCEHIAEPVSIVQHMKSADLRRPGIVWAVWDGVRKSGFWDTVPKAMPLYSATAA